MKPLIIYGTGKTAQVLVSYLPATLKTKIAAFTLESEFLHEAEFMNRPVVPFEDLLERYPPSQFDILLAVGYHDMNRQRERLFTACKALGYTLAGYIHPSVTYFDENQLGEGTVILDHVSIQPGASVGDGSFVWSNSVIAHGAQVRSHCWIAAGSTIAGEALIGDYCFLGVNSTVGHHAKLGSGTFVGANTLVTKNTHKDSVIISAEGNRIRLDSRRFMQFSKI